MYMDIMEFVEKFKKVYKLKIKILWYWNNEQKEDDIGNTLIYDEEYSFEGNYEEFIDKYADEKNYPILYGINILTCVFCYIGSNRELVILIHND